MDGSSNARAGSYAPLGAGIAAFVVLVVLLLLVGGLGAQSPPNERTEAATDGRGQISIGVSWGSPFEAFDTCVITPQFPGSELPNCYREKVARDSFIKQPLSVLAAVAFSVVGFVILFWTGRQGSTTSPFGPFYRAWFGFVALAMGPGSMVFHASLSSLAGWLDQVSMYMLLAFVLGYTILRLLPSTGYAEVIFGAIYFGLLIVFMVVGYLTLGEHALKVFAGIGIGVGLIDGAFALYLALGRGRYVRKGLRWVWSFVAFVVAMVVWAFSNPSILKEDPTDFPFHGIWHVLAAAFVAVYFWYLTSETARAPATRSN